jgi:hypothetical protein
MMQALIMSAALLLSLFGASARQGDERRLLDPKLVPAEGRTARDFVPRGWKLEGDVGEVAGDLDNDGTKDVVLRLVEGLPIEAADGTYNERSRSLIIILARPRSGFKRAAVATRLLGCTLCAGVLGDPAGGNIQIEIKNGVLNVNQLSGSREARDLTQRFRYDAASARFLLIGEDVNDYDRLNGASTTTSTNYLTGLRITKKMSPARGRREPVLISNKTTRIPVKRRFIEEMNYDERR